MESSHQKAFNDFQLRVIKKLERELGNDIMKALNDPAVIEIMLNSDGFLWVEKIGEPMQKIGIFPDGNALALMGTIASFLDTTVTPEKPILECELPIDGSRFAGVIPPVVAHPTFTIRKKAVSIFTIQDYVDKFILTKEQSEAIKEAILYRKNMLIVGGTGSNRISSFKTSHSSIMRTRKTRLSFQTVTSVLHTPRIRLRRPNCSLRWREPRPSLKASPQHRAAA